MCLMLVNVVSLMCTCPSGRISGDSGSIRALPLREPPSLGRETAKTVTSTGVDLSRSDQSGLILLPGRSWADRAAREDIGGFKYTLRVIVTGAKHSRPRDRSGR